MMKELATKTVLFQFFLLLILLSPCLSQEQSSFYFGPFNQSNYATLAVLPPATISNGALQVTPDSAGNFSLSNRSGRILLNQSFTLWKNHTSKTQSHIASFKSSFIVNLYRMSGSPYPGEGLAFLIAPNLSLPSDSHGQYLGLTNAASDGSAGNKIVAVELDTFKEAFDPDDNHLGLDVNSVRSVKTVSLSNLGIEIAPNGTKFYVVWVEYDGRSRRLSVFMAEQEREADDEFVIR